MKKSYQVEVRGNGVGVGGGQGRGVVPCFSGQSRNGTWIRDMPLPWSGRPPDFPVQMKNTLGAPTAPISVIN